MKVAELGEFGLIDVIDKLVSGSEKQDSAAHRQLILGIGDDAAAWHGDTAIQLATADAVVQGVHFSLDRTTWRELGWKSLAVNISDIAAMGGLPRYALVALTLPEGTNVEDITDLYKGMLEVGQQFDVAIVGGNISRAPLVSITITVLGQTRSADSPLLTRSSAKPGDKVAVTGFLGSAAAGLQMLTQQLKLPAGDVTFLRNAFLRPVPRVAEGQALAEAGVRTAIDVSDGLVSDLGHICQASRVGALINVDQVPVAPAVRANFKEQAVRWALSGGEDYELLFTARDEVVKKVTKLIACPITIIGEITAENPGKIDLVDGEGKPFKLGRAGWDHFAGKQ